MPPPQVLHIVTTWTAYIYSFRCTYFHTPCPFTAQIMRTIDTALQTPIHRSGHICLV